MDDNKLILSLKSLPEYYSAMEKLTTKTDQLNEDEKTFLLTVAIVLLRKYEKDHRYTSFVELGYAIILKYSLFFNDYTPLYDFCVNIGYYPIAQAITDSKKLQFSDIRSAIIPTLINEEFKRGNLIETSSQKHTRENILNSKSKDICYVAPTSFGKSSVILDHISKKWFNYNRFAIIVPTKSLLMQTYRSLRKNNFDAKIIIHDEMYNNEKRFIAVLTQERALRLLDKHNIFFDCLYIDEAHRLFDHDSRSVLLSRLIKLNRQRNPNSEIVYLSPLITDANNLKIEEMQNIFEQRIPFNIKEPEYFEYCINGNVKQYNRFIDDFFLINNFSDMFSYIIFNSTEKTFCYLYAPKKIEQFAEELAEKITEEVVISKALNETINNLKNYVHSDFYVIEYLKKGIVYLHGKMPENVKEYLEYKYSQIPELKYIIANKVILEGMNLPINSLFILNGTNLHQKDLTNLIGRVNRLDQIFTSPPKLEYLIPQIHFVNSKKYNRKNGNFESKMRSLKSSIFKDQIKNPILINFDLNGQKDKDYKKSIEIIECEDTFFSLADNPMQELKRKMIALGINSIINITDEVCQKILNNIEKLQDNPKSNEIHFLTRLYIIFIKDCILNIIDEEFARLKNTEAISYYKIFFKNRHLSFNENVAREIHYFKKRIAEKDCQMYIGKSYGEIPYSSTEYTTHQHVYIDLSNKTDKQLANIAIIKQKMEEDFVNYKLRMFFQLMFDYSILTENEYNLILYGTINKKKIYLVKSGLTINLINRLEKDDQLNNISFDEYGNLITNDSFVDYIETVDDFYRFELNRFL